MAYDAAKAHEYYLKYKKKGLKKGRKKGKSKTTKTKKTNLVGLSNSGLNDEGKMEWALAKEKLTSEMNDALKKATTQEEKDKIRAEYQNKAMAELKRMKSDGSLAKVAKVANAKIAKSSSSKSSGSSSKGSSSKGAGSSKSSSSGSSKINSGNSQSNTSNSSSSTASTSVDTAAVRSAKLAVMTESLGKINDMTAKIMEKLDSMTPEQRTEAKNLVQQQIDLLKKMLNSRTG